MNGRSSDVVVIGGGIVGVTAALFAAEAGASVTLLEAETVAAAASGRNAGSVQHPMDPARAELYAESVAIHQRFGTIAAEAHGLLAVGFDPAAPAAGLRAAAPFPDLRAELVQGAALRALEPELADGLTGCLISGTGFPAHPARATHRFAAAAAQRGALIETGVRATPEIVAGRCLGARGADGVLRSAAATLVAAGPWSSALVDPGWAAVRPVWGVTVQMALPPGRTVRHRLEEWDAGEDGAVGHFEATPFADVTVLGASASLSPPVERRVAALIRERAARFLPVVSRASVAATRSCARPVTADGLPLLGPVPGLAGLHIAAGHGPYGISLGPASGRVAADALLGRAPVPARFAVDSPARTA